MYRQGDVLLIPVEVIPKQAIERHPYQDRIVLALGETTGHAHVITADGLADFGLRGQRYLKIPPKGARLTHEEHAEIRIPAGAYRVVLQREYSPGETRYVAD